MASGQFVAYYRVSTTKQGQSGLGLEAQKESVTKYLNGGDWSLLAEFTEVETGKGMKALDKRPQLKAALALCKRTGATLVIAKLDRLARNVHFISGLMEARVRFVAVDMPEANELTIHVMAAFAEHESKRISQRTKEALAAAKARGKTLGTIANLNPQAGVKNLKEHNKQKVEQAQDFVKHVQPVFVKMLGQGLSTRVVAQQLNTLGIKTATGREWSQTQVMRIKKQLSA